MRLSSVLLTTFLVLATVPLSAQQQPRGSQRPDTAAARRAAEQQLGRNVSQSEILERIRQSGMTRGEIRSRLQQAGYDPGLADQYFDLLERGGEPPRGDAPDSFLQALGRIGISTRAGGRLAELDSLTADSLIDPQAVRDSLFADTVAEDADRQVFGLRTFRRASRQFDPALTGPVDRGYRIGPGDEILLVLTGDVEEAYSLEVTREGFIFIPDVGQVAVSGLTLDGVEDLLYSRLGRVYSGVSRSPGATTRFQVTVGELRSNQVFVRGEVTAPNAYQVSSVATLMTALYQAGGPTAEGSFRRVELHRGGQLAHVVDLYEFLVGGSVAGDVRLEHNDHIFVPPAGNQVRVEGSIRRPAIYELKAGEGVQELLTFAGGLRSDALARRVQVDRVLPPEEQRPGYYRTLLDIDLASLGSGVSTPLRDGDVVTVFAVDDERRNRVVVSGEVRTPGLFEWSPGATLWSLLQRADGLGERAYTARAHVFRIRPEDGSRQLIPVSLERHASGEPVADLALMDNDSIVVLSRENLRTMESVSIDGYVKFPDTYELARGMTLQDLILAAGGFTEGAYTLEAEISRLTDPLVRTDTTATVWRVPLSAAAPEDGSDGASSSLVPQWTPDAGDLELKHGDRVFIRRAPGYEVTRAVSVTGQVVMPGTYVLRSRGERLTEVLRRAGGLTDQAFPAGLHVVRKGRVVAGNLERALRDPRDRSNIVLMEGDSIKAPGLDPTVTVTGAVNFEARVLHRPGEKLAYYVNQAGGYTPAAEKGQVTITYPNGERSAVRRSFLGYSALDVQPGSVIFVPAKPTEGRGTNWDVVFARAAGLLGAVATIMLAVAQFD